MKSTRITLDSSRTLPASMLRASARDQAFVREQLADLVHARVLVRKDQVRLFQAIRGQRRTLRANLGQQVSQRDRERGLVVGVDRALKLAVQPVQLDGGRVVDLELPLARDPDDHNPSPSCGCSPALGRSETGRPAGGAGGAYWVW